MCIVDREAFLAMPAGTVFSKYEPCIFGNLEIKGESNANMQGVLIDFWSQDLAGALQADSTEEFEEACDCAAAGENIQMHLESQRWDGLYDRDQLFAVWESDDVRALIVRLQQALIETQP
ncbi:MULTISPECIES: hypothetical protein [unclassified Pseudomonas]|uniref:hypothetical protein n=1 Tax=unclassified Pseudomonas TaxID=196821 RepID=UPI0023625C66|nr:MULTISPECIES: hypothetical protein [unclassified Pseudomonas]